MPEWQAGEGPSLYVNLFDPGPDEPPLSKVDAYVIPHQLKAACEAVGPWSSVKMVANDSLTADFYLTGRVRKAGYRSLELQAQLIDVSGKMWMDRRFKGNADTRRRDVQGVSAFDSLFADVAREVADAMARGLSGEELKRIQQVAEMQYAASVSPEAYGESMHTGRGGITVVDRMPAANDPIYQRITRIRDREEHLVSSMDSYYDKALGEILPSYLEWQNLAARESARQKKYEQRSWLDGALLIAGELTSAGAMFVEAFEPGNAPTDVNGRTAADRGFEKGQKWSRGYGQKAGELARRLSESEQLASVEMEPYVFEMKGTTQRLTGTAREQFDQWRALIREVYAAETGF